MNTYEVEQTFDRVSAISTLSGVLVEAASGPCDGLEVAEQQVSQHFLCWINRQLHFHTRRQAALALLHLLERQDAAELSPAAAAALREGRVSPAALDLTAAQSLGHDTTCPLFERADDSAGELSEAGLPTLPSLRWASALPVVEVLEQGNVLLSKAERGIRVTVRGRGQGQGVKGQRERVEGRVQKR